MTGWTVIVPAKRWDRSKSRLELGPVGRTCLARAFALDVVHTLAAVETIAHLVIVTAEPELVSVGRGLGATVIDDRSSTPADPLNDAIRLGRGWAIDVRPDDPVVVVPGDLPALTPQTLDAALRALNLPGTSLVPDTAGTGTTLLAASMPALLRPTYGPDSARRHAASGGVVVTDVDRRVRRDVDTLAHLEEATALGLGWRTVDAVRGLGLDDAAELSRRCG